MDYVTLGRTGLRVSVIGLGGGGHSRLGHRTGASADASAAIVRRALDLGVNFIDTAEAYGTEETVGLGIKDRPRDQVILSTKKSMRKDGRVITPAELVAGLEASLARLGTDYVDIYHLHAVTTDQYEYVLADLVPELMRQRAVGKIRFLGITEQFGEDTGHAMLARAVREEPWDVVMVGFNVLNQSARERVLAETQQRDVGVLCMFAVRAALSQPDFLRRTVADLVAAGLVDRDALDPNDPLGFVREDGAASSVPEAAYRFCRAEPGIHVVLSGTGNIQHLEENVASLLKPPLPPAVHGRLVSTFARVDTVSGQ
jgi:aryl-alcohol dehydrogenase-like predicted oxidoreductase